MAYTEWEIQGVELSNCNCAVGCPCQFNALPTHGNCRAYGFMRVDQGFFGNTTLDGLHWGFLVAWPQAIHLGNGVAQVIVDERANADQRAALEAIAQGRETEPGSLITQVFSTTFSTVLPTLFKPVEFSANLESRTGTVRVPGVLDADISPIRNPVTGKPHYVKVTLPAGFEYTEAEYASGKAKAPGPIELDFDGTHAHLARIHWNTNGVVR